MTEQWGLRPRDIKVVGILGSKVAVEAIDKVYPEVEVSQNLYCHWIGCSSGGGVGGRSSGATTQGQDGLVPFKDIRKVKQGLLEGT